MDFVLTAKVFIFIMKLALVFTLETGTNYPIHPQPAVGR